AHQARLLRDKSQMNEGPRRLRLPESIAGAVEQVQASCSVADGEDVAEGVHRTGDAAARYRPFPACREIRFQPYDFAACADRRAGRAIVGLTGGDGAFHWTAAAL